VIEHFELEWQNWSKEKEDTIELPRDNLQHLAAVLMTLHSALHNKMMDVSYSGPMINSAIREWKPSPGPQKFISKSAFCYLVKGGKKKNLKREHDPPISFYRDLIRKQKSLTESTLLEYLRFMKVTWLERDENKHFDKRFKSSRPPTAYEEFPITRLPYPPDAELIAQVRQERINQGLPPAGTI